MFEINESEKDRRNRGLLGLVLLLVSAFLFSSWLKIVASIIGVLLIFTAITGYCALYRVFKVSTIKKEEKK